MASLVLLISIGLFLYPFLIYPALLNLLVRRRRNGAAPSNGVDPAAVMLICALNEQNIIRDKMENCLRLQYPRNKLRIVVISDGSTDRTADIVREYAAQGIELIQRTERRGKLANLNSVIPTFREEIVILSDANVIYHPEAIQRLVSRLRDESIGCVSGKVILTDNDPSLADQSDNYYSLEWSLQEAESAVHSMVGADGAMYAIRRELFQPCPEDTLIEDFTIAINIVRQGKRVVFEPEALGWEQGPTSIREEFRRKVRIAAGAAQVLFRVKAWPYGAPFRFWFLFLSHKMLRWLSPVFGMAILLTCLLSIGEPLSKILLCVIALLGGLALLKLFTGSVHPALSAPFYFLFGQVAFAMGLLRGITGTQSVLWTKANR